ncbi:hypothetical protein [Rhodococcus sp. KRD162]|uniref:hypothetical protein n=1 Tax=Rhodococcus sp. KRD162 TaxID=2729725 RepID=UPI0019D248D4|nr:hypothetical protein [Rhodococcus sp. KRD162]
MSLALCAITIAVLLHVVAARIAVRENYGNRLPTVNGSYPGKSVQRARSAQAAGWMLSVVGALQLGHQFWLTEPWLALGVVVTVLVLVNGLPSLLVTMLHNGKLRSQPQG